MAAVCPLETAAPVSWMLAVAAEMNLSETAFLVPREDGHSIRYFTPLVEVALCGHATLASAHVLWEQEPLSHEQAIRLYAKGGQLTARCEGAWICLDFPAIHTVAAALPDGLESALGAEICAAYRGWETGYLVLLNSETAVLTGRQLSRRGGIVRVRVHGERVELLGQAVTVMRGEIVTSAPN